MEAAIQNIYNIIKDYRNHDGIHVTPDDIREWAMQFNDDAQFMAEEIAHLLPKIYFSKEKISQIASSLIRDIYKKENYHTFDKFLSDVKFLKIQPDGKSQSILIDMLDNFFLKKTKYKLSDFDDKPKKIFIYIDDVLASGKTIANDLINWINTDNHIEELNQNRIKLYVPIICVHRWGYEFQKWRITKTFSNLKSDRINWLWHYEVQNHLKFNNQSLNLAIPVKDQPKNVAEYLESLDAEKYEDYAYRNDNQPFQETFFTSPENRIRYEHNLLQAGLNIISKITPPVSKNIRPLGFINPNYKTFGIGTHFITWRNIPNNSPLALWWDVDAHGWKPLFPPKR